MRTHQRLIDADIRARELLAAANEAAEAGLPKKAARLYDAAQRALDRYNRLAGRD